DDFTAEVGAAGADEGGVAVAFGDDDDLALLGRLAADVGDADRELGLDGGDLDAVDGVGGAAQQVVVDLEDVLAVLGDGEAEVGVRAAGVVIGGQARAVALVNDQDRVERRAERAGVDADV